MSILRGPSGFLELSGNTFVVDYGKIFDGNEQVGFLFENGLLQSQGMKQGHWQGLKALEELPGCVFRGIDSYGIPLEMPGTFKGPTGGLKYNGLPFTAICGRVANQNNELIGSLEDDGKLYFRDLRNPSLNRLMDESSKLNCSFQGILSNGKPATWDFQRPLYRSDKTYKENEIIRYFVDYDAVSFPQKKYVLETMDVFAASGLLQLVRKSEGNAALGNVKHGAAGVTGVRTGNVTLDKEEFEKEVVFYKRFGPLMAMPTSIKPYLEVRINMVVAHEYGHQLEFCLSQATQGQITDLYEQHLVRCNKEHPLPPGYEGYAELLAPPEVEKRTFISGYARTSMHEYWAEAVAAFSVKSSRDVLRQVDPAIYELLKELVLHPESLVSPIHRETILELQTSLFMGGELSKDILEQ